MIQIEKVTTDIIDLIIDYIFENQDKVEKVINDFGEISSENGYGTFFLKPNNPLFKVFWVYTAKDKVWSIGFGGTNLGLTLKELMSVYKCHNKQFIPYDNEYHYAFYKAENSTSCVKIRNKNKLDLDGIIDDIAINDVDITILIENNSCH